MNKPVTHELATVITNFLPTFNKKTASYQPISSGHLMLYKGAGLNTWVGILKLVVVVVK
jgi:hypothetical protein